MDADKLLTRGAGGGVFRMLGVEMGSAPSTLRTLARPALAAHRRLSHRYVSLPDTDVPVGTAETLDLPVLCASPVDVTPNLNLQRELAHLESRVHGAPIPVRLRRVYPPTFRALERALSPRTLERFRPQVFHFLGHGEEDGLWLEDERGAGELVATARLRRLLAAPDSPLRLALVNACWSGTGRTESVCRALVAGDSPIRAAVGHDKPVADESAIGFVERFFEGLWGIGGMGKAALARLAQGLPRNGARTRIAPREDLPTTRALDLTRGLDDYNGAFYAHWVAETQAIRPLADQPPRLEPGGRKTSTPPGPTRPCPIGQRPAWSNWSAPPSWTGTRSGDSTPSTRPYWSRRGGRRSWMGTPWGMPWAGCWSSVGPSSSPMRRITRPSSGAFRTPCR
jgi:hypothetical protein